MLALSRSLPLLAAILALPSFSHGRSGVPPAGRAGDPGNLTCQAGCHPSFPLNSGDVTMLLADSASMMPITAYEPDQAYTLTLGIQSGEAGRNIWGFQATPLDATDSAAGSLMAGPGTATALGAGGRTYVHHSGAPTGFMGATWDFNWTAPSAGTGAVSFYTCGNAGDRNFSASQDYIECDTFVLMESVAAGDRDMDGLDDDVEIMIGTDPDNPDSDGDGLLDGEEVNDTMTNPLEPDTDGDTIEDGDEVNGGVTDPRDLDTDDDGLPDTELADFGTQPDNCDSDGDGITDGTETGVMDPIMDPDGAGPLLGTDTIAPCAVPSGLAFNADQDGAVTDPTTDDSDGDDCLDGEEDANGNGAFDAGEPGDTSQADCFLTAGGLLRVARTLGDPPLGAAHEVFDLVPCTRDNPDLGACAEFAGTIDDVLDPALPVSVAGDGVLVFLQFDSDTGAPDTIDSIRVTKDTMNPGDVIVGIP